MSPASEDEFGAFFSEVSDALADVVGDTPELRSEPPVSEVEASNDSSWLWESERVIWSWTGVDGRMIEELD